VLVVDDDPMVRAILHRVIEGWGYVCDEAGDGAAALEHLASRDCALVITDYDMPTLDGLGLLRALAETAKRHQRRPIPAILVSGSAPNDVIADAVTAGAAAVFSKPVDLSRLRAEIERVVSNE
jgi:two-component system chemotaxis response regulator CheY